MPLKLLGHFYLDSYRLLYGSFLPSLVQLLMTQLDSMQIKLLRGRLNNTAAAG